VSSKKIWDTITFPKGETPIPLPFAKGGAAVQSQTMAPDGGRDYPFFKRLNSYKIWNVEKWDFGKLTI